MNPLMQCTLLYIVQRGKCEPSNAVYTALYSAEGGKCEPSNAVCAA